jgi:hypothetical protein
MPNWCQNRLEIYGPKDAIAKIAKSCRLLDGEFDLNGIVPMPPELDITCGSPVDRGLDILYGDWERVLGLPSFRDLLLEITGGYLPETRDDLIRLIETEGCMYGAAHRGSLNFISLREARQAKANLDRFGFKDWYEWRIANWGTKWNVEKDVDIDDLSNESITLTFSTAWSPPIPAVEALCDQYPEISVTLRYIETGNWFAGTVYGEDGAIRDYPENDDGIRTFGEEFFGMEFDDGEDEAEIYEEAAT